MSDHEFAPLACRLRAQINRHLGAERVYRSAIVTSFFPEDYLEE